METGHAYWNGEIKLLQSSKDYNLKMLVSIFMHIDRDGLLNIDLSSINDNMLLDILK